MKSNNENLNTHIYLYAKKWYIRTDLINDLKILVARRCGCYPENISMDDILIVLTGIVGNHLLQGNFEYKFRDFISDLSPNSAWKFSNTEQYDFNKQLISKCLSVLSLVSIEEIPGFLGNPDSSILPVTENAKKIFKF